MDSDYAIYLRSPGPRPAFHLVADSLWGKGCATDSDGNSYNAFDTEWTELSLSLRGGTELDQVHIDLASESPLILVVRSPSQVLCEKAAIYLQSISGGTIEYGLTINSSESLSTAAQYAHLSTMKKFVIDCSTVTREMELWEKYVEVTEPEGLEFFGYGLDSFNDAITGGGPGFPGECEIYFTNTARIQRFRDGAFYKSLERIANESTSARIFLEPRIVPSTKPWWKFW